MHVRRTPLLSALFAVLALTLVGCGDSGSISATGDTQPISDAGSAGGTGDTGDSGDSGDAGDTGSSDSSLPDLGDLPGDTEGCIALGLAIGSSAAAGIGVGDPAELKKLEEEFAQYQEQVPEELRDDLQVMQEAFQKVADEGFVAGGEAMSTPEFESAQANIETYMNENCGG